MDTIAVALCDCLRLAGGKTINLTSFSDQDWVAVSALARRQGVSKLFYQSLRSHADEIHPPTEVIAALRDDSLYASTYSIRYQHELSRVLQTLQSAGLPVIILKGAYLAEQVYEQPSKRLMGDLDSLIQNKDLQPAVTALETLGYQPPVPISVKFETRVAQHMQSLIKKGALAIEIHWTLAVPGSPQ